MGKLSPHFYKGLIEAGCDEAGRGCLAGSVYAAAVILPDGYDNAELNDSKKLTEKRRMALRDQIQRDAVAWAVGIVTPEEIDEINILHASFLAMHRAIAALSVRPQALIIDGNRFDPIPRIPRSSQPDSSLSALHSSLSTPDSSLSPLHSSLSTPDSSLSALHSSLPTPDSSLSPLHSSFSTPDSSLSPLHSSLSTPDSSLSALHSSLPYTCIVHGDAKYQAIAAASILAKTYRDEYMCRLDEEFPAYHWRKNKGYPTKEHRAAIVEHGITKYHRKSYNLYGDRQLELKFE